jgi:hypothetical protein
MKASIDENHAMRYEEEEKRAIDVDSSHNGADPLRARPIATLKCAAPFLAQFSADCRRKKVKIEACGYVRLGCNFVFP